MKKTLCCSLVILLASCMKKESDTTDEQLYLKNESVDLELIDSIPVQGCGEYLSYDSIKGIPVKYLFVSDLQKSGLIRIGGKNIGLVKDSVRSRDIDDKNRIEYFKNGNLEATIRLNEIEKYDEGGFYQGTITIRSGAKKKTYKVKGDSGC